MLYAVVAYYSNLANSLTDGHNSNSYVSGLIQATGGTVVVNMQDGQRIEIDWGDYIGGDQPVLPFHFGEPNPGCPNR